MSITLEIPQQASRAEIYQALAPQLESVLEGESDFVANLANTAALIKESFHFFWVGFYLVKNQQLVLGPFQGPLACTRIDFNRGVCGAAYRAQKTLVVPNVDEFPGHIACSSLARSEIVVPIFNSRQEVIGVLDVDSQHLNDFDSVDQKGLEALVKVLERSITKNQNDIART